MSTHTVYVKPTLVLNGIPINKESSSIKQVSLASTELRIVPDISIPNSLSSPTIDNYIELEESNNYKVKHISNTMIVTEVTEFESSFGFNIDAGDELIQIGVKEPALVIPYNCTIKEWSIIANTSGSAQIDIWRDNLTKPIDVSKSICGNIKPNLNSQEFNTGSDLTNWSTEINKNDIIVFKIDSVSGLSKINLILLTLQKLI